MGHRAQIAASPVNQEPGPLDDHPMQAKLLLCLTPLLLCLGCGSKKPTCSETAHIYGMEQPNAAGITGNALAKHAIGVHAITLSLTPDQAGQSPVTPAFPDNTPGTLTVSLQAGAQWTHIVSERAPCSAGMNCADVNEHCVDQFSIPVQARLSAFNGTIDEIWQGQLVGSDPSDPQAHLVIDPQGAMASLNITRPASSFLGNLKIAAPTVPTNHDLTLHDISLTASFKDGALIKSEITDNSTSQETGNADAPVFGAGGKLIAITPVPKAG